jgi:hypothetical protein
MKTLGLFLLACLCSVSAYRLFDGWLAALWVPGAFAVPWLLRDEIAKRVTNPLPIALTLGLLLLALFTTGCAATGSTAAPVEDPDYYEHRISVQTLPPGAIIDWNNNVVGISPCEIVIPKSFKGHWPNTPSWTETLRARWPDGMWQEQDFDNRRPAPQRVVFLHANPAAHHPQPARQQ